MRALPTACMRAQKHHLAACPTACKCSPLHAISHCNAVAAAGRQSSSVSRRLQRQRRSSSLRAAADEGDLAARDAEDDGPPVVDGDWRAFRSRLVAGSAEQAASSSRHTPENMAVLREQVPYLAEEGLWAREADDIAAGTLLLAMPEAPLLSGDGRVSELVVLLLRHDAEAGSQGIMLNRPCFANVGDLLGWGWGTGAASGPIFEAFAESPVYLGGMFAPSKVARQGALMLHGQADLRGSSEVVPGIYCGGEQAAAEQVLQGAASPMEYRFFSGSVSWQPKQLQREVASGIWRKAECSRSVVLKQCMQLPVSMWREVHRLMDIAVE